MNFKLLVLRLLLIVCIGAVFLLYRQPSKTLLLQLNMGNYGYLNKENEEEEGEETAKYSEERYLHEFKMLRNPITGRIPADYRQIELAVARQIPEKGRAYNPFLSSIQNNSSTTVQNTYINIGPNNVAGRSRTLGIDRRNVNIMLTGGTTGGIFRSNNGGTSWTFVSPENDIRSANSIAQDPVTPDNWYCGTGEAWYPVSTADISNATYGYGIYKSTNNGTSWAKLPFTIANNNENAFDNAFDLVHRIAVHPTTGHVYAAAHRRIMRSTDGGQTWTAVMEGTSPTGATGGVTEVVIPSNGTKIYAAVTGENPDRNFAGVWESATGAPGSWVRIAGGVSGQADSVAGWRPYGKWGRIVLNLNNANNQLLVLYKNGESASGSNPRPEADLFRANLTGTPPNYAWTNLSDHVPDEPNFNEEGIDPYTTQFNGFNMSIAVKPDNDNILFIGGTNLHRVTVGEPDLKKRFRRMGGYGEGFFPEGSDNFFYPNHHPDVHFVLFANNSTDVLYTASDGGIHKTATSVMADTVQWTPLTANLQTLQYQSIGINPVPEGNLDFIIGGTQDNGTLINLNFQSTNPANRERHDQILSGDGASSAVAGFTKTGNAWRQFWYASVVTGAIYRYDINLNVGNGNLDLAKFDEITPTGLRSSGQWLTLFINDQDSTEHMYYNNRNRLFRTTNASTVTSSTWIEMTGVSNTIPANNDFTAMAISKRAKTGKFLFIGTDAGKVYRLDNPNTAAATAIPVDITPSQMTAGSYVAGIAVNPRNADTVLAVVSNYDQAGTEIKNIFWTGNATAATPTWQVIDGALAPVSSQSCAIVVTTGGVEYYVGTSVGLYSTTTLNGNNTQWFNEGGGLMKRAIIRSLVNRQRDNTLVVGTHGNGGFIAKIGKAVNLDVATGINPVTNDNRFIVSVYPTISRNLVQYTIGTMFSIKRISVNLYNNKGQLVYRQERGYQNGNINVTGLPTGNYILNIISDDGKYRHVQKIIKQ